jgi:hypothetical protein
VVSHHDPVVDRLRVERDGKRCRQQHEERSHFHETAHIRLHARHQQ